jgi:arsenite methyltransferase
MALTSTVSFDPRDLEAKVKSMYRAVAEDPDGEFHFEMGRAMAERLGYDPADLDRIPAESIASFAGVGYYFDLAALKFGETVVDLGSGSGMDAFVAALKVGKGGQVIGIDMTDEQLDKAERLRAAGGFGNISYRKGYIDQVPLDNATADAVISNGVINLVPDKAAAFREAARILRSGGRLAIADIVTDHELPENVTCNADLWAACIGGALQRDRYSVAIESAGLRIKSVRENTEYRFLSENAQGAQKKWGVKSISLLAVKP